ncbi:acyltransferase domain-containing protein [Lysinibacillus sp. NPDC092081]|uniref:acyltransferase domain-containing protein n=1 Tax=Lysinibacillus sp. NPDC092081 TaxID=3364131 RepID=UPI0037FC8318
MRKEIVFMFSGQGSQYFQMGKELFEKHSIFRDWMIKLDQIVDNLIGESIIEQIYDVNKKRDQEFYRILHTSPAIFMVEYSLAQTLIESGIKPNYVLGTSLGEFTAAAVAQVMSVEEILEVIIRKSDYIEKHCPAGGMLAILHASSLYFETPFLYENSELASINYSDHFVISGKINNLTDIQHFLNNKGIINQRLPVRYGFHSHLIDNLEVPIKQFLEGKNMHEPKIPFISCLEGRIIEQLSKDYFWKVIREPINIPKFLNKLEKNNAYIYLDLGTSGTMGNFVKRNINRNSQSEIFSIMSIFNQDFENLEHVKSLFVKKSFLGR